MIVGFTLLSGGQSSLQRGRWHGGAGAEGDGEGQGGGAWRQSSLQENLHQLGECEVARQRLACNNNKKERSREVMK